MASTVVETADEIAKLLEREKNWLRWSSEARVIAEGAGLAVTPTGFYYPVPTLNEIADSFEYQEDSPFWNDELFLHDRLKEKLSQLLPFAAEFNPPREGDREKPEGYFWTLGPFAYCDALAYYAQIRAYQPEVILEIGSGSSTLVAREAIRKNGRGSIICVEPFPPAYLRDLEEIELQQRPAQSLSPDEVDGLLGRKGLLFIDSTHTVKTGSDCVHLYLRVLPKLRNDVLVHVHDVFLPAPLPRKWLEERHVYWAEQYLLMAYLLDNPRTEIIYGSTVNLLLFPELMREMAGGKTNVGGGSIWFQLRAKRHN